MAVRRRAFIAGLGGVAAWPLAAKAQQSRAQVIGLLGSASASSFAPQLDGLRIGLGDAGYVENRNVTIEYRWAEGQYERLPALLTELVQHNLDMILAVGSAAAVAVKAANTTIPMVFVVGTDPVSDGLVKSLSHPGANRTGMYLYIGGLVTKKLELLRETLPNLDRFALVVNPGTPSAKLDSEEIEAVNHAGDAPVMSIMKASTDREIDSVFAELAARRVAAVIGSDAFFFARRAHLAEVAARMRVPAIYYAREFVTAGGLDELWREYSRHLSSSGSLRCTGAQRRETG